MQTELLETQPDSKNQHPIQIKLKPCGGAVAPDWATNNSPVLAVSPPNTKRTQKAKSRTTGMNAGVLLPNSIEEIIGDMLFQEPNPSAPVISGHKQQQQQPQTPLNILSQKQQELLFQLQQGIRPGWFIQCIAKRADGKQCTRNIKKGSEFCMGHSTKCIYGRITDLVTPIAVEKPESVAKKPSAKPNRKHPIPTDTSMNIGSGLESKSGGADSGSEDEDNSFELHEDVREALIESEAESEAEARLDADSKPGTKSIPRSKSVTKSRTAVKSKKPGAVSNTADATAEAVPVVPKKRGRRRKLPIDPRFGNNDYIIMWPIICEDQRYLTDRNDNIYSNEPERPVFIGIREVNGKINRSGPPKNC